MGEDAWLEAAYEDRHYVPDEPSDDYYEDEDPGPDCTRCGDEITGAVWNGGRCLDCHEAELLPETAEDRWQAAYAD